MDEWQIFHDQLQYLVIDVSLLANNPYISLKHF